MGILNIRSLPSAVRYALSGQRDRNGLRGIILDLDATSDCENPSGLALAHVLADRGECNPLAVIIDTTNAYAPVSADAVNVYHHRSLAVGANKGTSFLPTSEWTQNVAENFANNLVTVDNASEGVALYKQILARAALRGIKILTAGPLNMLAALLADPQGMALVRSKVNEIVIAAGHWPDSASYPGTTFPAGETDNNIPAGTEYNLGAAKQSAHDVFATCPVPITICGCEMADGFLATKTISSDTPSTNPVRRAYELFHSHGMLRGRQPWTQQAVLYAVRGLAHEGTTYFTRVRGTGAVNATTGANTWTDGATGPHSYLVKSLTDEQFVALLDPLTLTLPDIPLLRDTFVDANGTALSAHTIAPYNTPAAAWSGDPATIQSNTVVVAPTVGGEARCLFESGVANPSIRVDVQLPASGVINVSVFFNMVDALNGWAVTLYADAVPTNRISIHQITNGVYTAWAGNSSAGLVNGQQTTIRVAVEGDTVTALVGTVRATYTVANRTNKTATKCGLRRYAKSTPDAYTDGGTVFTSFQVLN